jgi:hypothetical protein
MLPSIFMRSLVTDTIRTIKSIVYRSRNMAGAMQGLLTLIFLLSFQKVLKHKMKYINLFYLRIFLNSKNVKK